MLPEDIIIAACETLHLPVTLASLPAIITHLDQQNVSYTIRDLQLCLSEQELLNAIARRQALKQRIESQQHANEELYPQLCEDLAELTGKPLEEIHSRLENMQRFPRYGLDKYIMADIVVYFFRVHMNS